MSTRKCVVTLTAGMILVLAGCTRSVEVRNAGNLAADGSAASGLATVYVIRGDYAGRGLLSTNVELDGVSQGWLKLGTSVHFNVQPGHHELHVAFPMLLEPGGSMAIGADFSSNKTYYFYWNGRDAGQMLQFKLGQVTASHGKQLARSFPERH